MYGGIEAGVTKFVCAVSDGGEILEKLSIPTTTPEALNCSQSSVIILLLRLVPLSVMILSGTPYRQIRLCRMKRATTLLVTVA